MARCIEGKPNRFITITCRAGQFGTKAQNAAAISHAFSLAVLAWRRQKAYHKCQYIAVFEPHVSGWPHLHVLWTGHWIQRKWLSRFMNTHLNSPMVHVSRIKGAKSAAFYVAKYFSKAPEKFGNSKRYWTSKLWPKLLHIDAQRAFHKGFPIELVNKRISDILTTWRHYNKTVWTRAPDIVGWGVLWEASDHTLEKHKPPWNHSFGFQVSRLRRGPAPMARGRGEGG